jgi:hypothetical protein
MLQMMGKCKLQERKSGVLPYLIGQDVKGRMILKWIVGK